MLALAAVVGMAMAPGRAMAARTLGIDVSSYQGSINWSSVRGAGYTFAWAKATEGTGWTDGYLGANQDNGKAAGVYMGAYHFAHPESNTPGAEASHFWNVAKGYIKADGKTLMPMLDVEVLGSTGANGMSDWVNQWCRDVIADAEAEGVTVKPVVYVSSCNACWFNSSVAQWHSWLANYNGESPWSGTPWSICGGCDIWNGWELWQYSQSTWVSGAGTVDADVFNGSSSSLVSTLVVGGSSPSGPSYAYFDSGVNNAAWSTGIAHWSASSSGGSDAVWSNGDYAYFYSSAVTPANPMNVSIGSAGVTSPRISGNTRCTTDIAFNNNTINLVQDSTLPGYATIRIQTAHQMMFNCVLAGSTGAYFGYDTPPGGSFVLGGNNTYSGGTIIGAGRVVIQNGVNATGGGGVVVTNDPKGYSSAGVLTWNNSTATIHGSVTLHSADPSLIATLGPAGGVASLNIQGGITFDANSRPIFTLSPTYNGANDKVVVHNGVNGGGVQVGISCGATLDTTHDYVLFTSTAGTITGDFDPTPMWTDTTPAYADQYSIVTSGNEVHLHYSPVAAVFFDSASNGAGWSASAANWSTSSGGGGTLIPWSDNNFAYFYASDITPGAMNVSVGSAGVSAERVTLQSGAGNLSINNNTVTLVGGANLAGYCLLRNETANNLIFNSVLAGSAGLYMGYSMGSGSIVLGANNTYSGGTIVGNGRLVIQNGVNATGSGGVVVTNDPNNASYVGALTWNTSTAAIQGSVTLHSADPSLIATLGPAGGVASLNIQGGITFDANSQPIFSLSPTYNGANDKVVVHNGVNGGGVQIGISCGATLDTTHDYVLFSSTTGITGNFNTTPIWMATTPAYASQYSIITSGTEVHLHYTPVIAAFFDSSTSGAAWSTGSANWSTSSGGGGTLVSWGNSDYAYFYASDRTPGAMNVSVGSAGVTSERITLQSGGGDLNINNNTVTLTEGSNLAGYCLLRNETANNMVFNSVIAGSVGLYMGYSMGSGSIVLGANNTYSGGTLVGNGRLVIQNGANATGSGDVQVTNDPNNASYVGALTWNTATATIAGSVSLSSASPSLIARLGPSSGVSALHIGGNLGFGANSEPVFALSSSAGGANDRVVVGSSLSGGAVPVGIQCGATLDTTQDYVLFTASAVTTNFNATPVWTATTPQYAGQYTIITSGPEVHLHFNPSVPCGQTNMIAGIANNHDGTFTLSFIGTPQSQYYLLASPDATAPLTNWFPLAGSTNTVTNESGQWQLTVTNYDASQQYYRAAAVIPCP
jgi:autotransporter-associated beta strand protein